MPWEVRILQIREFMQTVVECPWAIKPHSTPTPSNHPLQMMLLAVLASANGARDSHCSLKKKSLSNTDLAFRLKRLMRKIPVLHYFLSNVHTYTFQWGRHFRQGTLGNWTYFKFGSWKVDELNYLLTNIQIFNHSILYLFSQQTVICKSKKCCSLTVLYFLNVSWFWHSFKKTNFPNHYWMAIYMGH